jgi:hypothetical protein
MNEGLKGLRRDGQGRIRIDWEIRQRAHFFHLKIAESILWKEADEANDQLALKNRIMSLNYAKNGTD